MTHGIIGRTNAIVRPGISRAMQPMKIGVAKNCMRTLRLRVATAPAQFIVRALNKVVAAVPVVVEAMPARPSAVMATRII
jgi:hypothetical protein